MADEQDKLKLSLEAPKLFGRKKKSAPPSSTPAPTSHDEDPTTSDEPGEELDEELDVVDEVEVEDEVEADEADADAEDEPTVVIEPADEPVDEPTQVIEPAEETEPVVEPVVEPVAKAKPAVAATKAAPVAKAPEIEPEPVSDLDLDLEDAEIAALTARQGPLLSLYQSAALTGLVVGAAMVVLTWLSLRGCEAVRGTASCGGGPGFILLVATFALCVLLGSALLKAFTIPDPGSSSFLAVGLVAVIALLFLIDLLDSLAMLVIIPLLSVGGYLASVWVTKTFVEPVDS